MRVYLHNTHLNYASQVTQCLVGLKTSQKDSKYTHVHWESSDRSVQILDQEVSNLEAARTTEEGSTKGGVTPEMVCSSTLPQAPAVGSSQREDAGLDGTFLHRKQFLSPYTLAMSIPSHLQPRFHMVFQFLSSLRETASIKRHYCWCDHQWLLLKIHAEMCAVHREAELKYPSLLPSLPSSTCNRKSRNLSTTISCQKAIYIP